MGSTVKQEHPPKGISGKFKKALASLGTLAVVGGAVVGGLTFAPAAANAVDLKITGEFGDTADVKLEVCFEAVAGAQSYETMAPVNADCSAPGAQWFADGMAAAKAISTPNIEDGAYTNFKIDGENVYPLFYPVYRVSLTNNGPNETIAYNLGFPGTSATDSGVDVPVGTTKTVVYKDTAWADTVVGSWRIDFLKGEYRTEGSFSFSQKATAQLCWKTVDGTAEINCNPHELEISGENSWSNGYNQSNVYPTTAPEIEKSTACGILDTIKPSIDGNYTYSEPQLVSGNTYIVHVLSTGNGHITGFSPDSYTVELFENTADCNEDMDIVVVPVEPTLAPAQDCGIEATVNIPTVAGVDYGQVRNGNVVTVTAVPQSGYTFGDLGDSMSWNITIPDVVPCDQLVNTVAPTLNPSDECGVEGTVNIPTVPGVEYAQTREGQIVTVTAKAMPGYKFVEGAVTEWTIEIPEAEKCDEVVVPVAPTLVPAEDCDTEATVTTAETPGVVYEQTREGALVTVTAKALPGYKLDPNVDAVWYIEIPAVDPCEVSDTIVTPEEPTLVPSDECGVEGTINIPDSVGVSYEQTREGQTVTVKATALQGYIIKDGATTEWVIEIPEAVACPGEDVEVTPVAPELVKSDTCDVEATVEIAKTEGVSYTQTREGNVVTVKAAALEGYKFEDGVKTEWDITIPDVKKCSETPVTPEDPESPKPTDPANPVKTGAKGGLAVTGGSNLMGLGIIGAIAAAGGAVALIATRRRGNNA